MPSAFRFAYIVHSLRSDWNNGNAHFLRGLMRSLTSAGQDVLVLEPEIPWSLQHLLEEITGTDSLARFSAAYPDIRIQTYLPDLDRELWRELLVDRQIVILHEWNPPELAKLLLELRDEIGYQLLFHDTHHRASSSPEQIDLFGIAKFNGVLAFGEVLRRIYADRFGISKVWTLHEAADTTIFRPDPGQVIEQDVLWIGNWGDEERSAEISQFLLQPAARLRDLRFTIYGVRYPPEGTSALADAGVQYGGYLPNLAAPAVYASSRICMHVPRRQYATTMKGIPTIRVFEALACGIPLVSAPWQDTEKLFRSEDIDFVHSAEDAAASMRKLIDHPALAERQAASGLATVLDRHTCGHRAAEVVSICEELLQ